MVGYFKPCFLSLLKLFMYSLFTFYYSITSKNEIKIIGSAAGPGGLMPCFEYKNVFIGSTVPCLWIVHLSPLTIAVIISVWKWKVWWTQRLFFYVYLFPCSPKLHISLGGGFRRLNLYLFIILISGMRRQPNKNEKEKQSISVRF